MVVSGVSDSESRPAVPILSYFLLPFPVSSLSARPDFRLPWLCRFIAAWISCAPVSICPSLSLFISLSGLRRQLCGGR
jgi:hypothetical protein